MQIQIEIKSVYGELKAYPACDKAKLFAEMLGTKTLTHSALIYIERLGYSIEQAPQQFNFRKSA
ncbi:MAG: hypothetical protein EB015_13170 [Methylocystaceae bacterium]|nr:hypothetical protein [Methylocystaceae bacterium]